MKKHAIWQDHKVTGYIDLTDEQAEQLNGIHGIGAYFGHDEETRDEFPWIRIISNKYAGYGIENGSKHKVHRRYPGRKAEIGSVYGPVFIEPDSYEILSELPDGKELILYGEILFDIETEEYEGFRRIRVIRLNGVLYMHHSFNGELLEYMELQDLKGQCGEKNGTV